MAETVNFSRVAEQYSEAAVVQQKAADRLFQLLRIKDGDDVLDAGCGSGSLTARIRSLTRGRVVGLDAARGMIETARADPRLQDIEFIHAPVQELPALCPGSFDVVFCNSSLHWMTPLSRALAGMHAVLKPGGKLGVQAAAMSEYCPNFIRALGRISRDPRTSAGFKSFVPPWSFLESEDAYIRAFEQAGFRVAYSAIDQVHTRHTVNEAYGVFSAGAAAGYLDQDNYRQDYQGDYLKDFQAVIRASLEEQADADGSLELSFNRLYLVAFRR